jgi:hypothetical protein
LIRRKNNLKNFEKPLESVGKRGKQGYIKQLIRADLNREGPE